MTLEVNGCWYNVFMLTSLPSNQLQWDTRLRNKPGRNWHASHFLCEVCSCSWLTPDTDICANSIALTIYYWHWNWKTSLVLKCYSAGIINGPGQCNIMLWYVHVNGCKTNAGLGHWNNFKVYWCLQVISNDTITKSVWQLVCFTKHIARYWGLHLFDVWTSKLRNQSILCIV